MGNFKVMGAFQIGDMFPNLAKGKSRKQAGGELCIAWYESCSWLWTVFQGKHHNEEYMAAEIM